MKKTDTWIYAAFFLVYIALLIFNLSRNSQWALDSATVIFLLVAFIWLNRWFKVKAPSILLFNAALIVHILGSFGAYELGIGFFEYDNLVHIFASFAAGFIITKIIAHRLHVKEGLFKKTSDIDEHKKLTFFLVLSLVIFLGVLVEVVEFGGFSLLGSGEGIFFYGSGDFGAGDLAREYVDVMTDILSNILGAFLGVLAYYVIRYKKKYS